jgi:hypothetical protein
MTTNTNTRTITAKSLTDHEIRVLRAESAEAADYQQVAICDLALHGEIDADDYTTLERDEARMLAEMTRAEAVEECARVIAEAKSRAASE